jgi:predicted transcriptional regulator
MMRTTIRLDSGLLGQAKKLAAESHQTLTAIIEDALRERLARRKSRPRAAVRVTTFRGDGLVAGVDLDDTAALEEVMEER